MLSPTGALATILEVSKELGKKFFKDSKTSPRFNLFLEAQRSKNINVDPPFSPEEAAQYFEYQYKCVKALKVSVHKDKEAACEFLCANSVEAWDELTEQLIQTLEAASKNFQRRLDTIGHRQIKEETRITAIEKQIAQEDWVYIDRSVIFAIAHKKLTLTTFKQLFDDQIKKIKANKINKECPDLIGVVNCTYHMLSSTHDEYKGLKTEITERPLLRTIGGFAAAIGVILVCPMIESACLTGALLNISSSRHSVIAKTATSFFGKKSSPEKISGETVNGSISHKRTTLITPRSLAGRVAHSICGFFQNTSSINAAIQIKRQLKTEIKKHETFLSSQNKLGS